MLLTIFKWLTWLSAIALVLALVFVGASVGIIELIVTLVLAGIISVPGWIIHFVQKGKKRKAA
jgi:fatty acid desaturase